MQTVIKKNYYFIVKSLPSHRLDNFSDSYQPHHRQKKSLQLFSKKKKIKSLPNSTTFGRVSYGALKKKRKEITFFFSFSKPGVIVKSMSIAFFVKKKLLCSIYYFQIIIKRSIFIHENLTIFFAVQIFDVELQRHDKFSPDKQILLLRDFIQSFCVISILL